MAIFCAGCTVVAQQTDPKPYRNSGTNAGELSIVAAKVQMLLIAPDGRKTGFDVKTRKIVRGIPHSAYDQDALLQYDSGRVDPDTTQTIDVEQATRGKYRLVVSPGSAADGEAYEVRVTLYLHEGGEARTTRIAGTAERGKAASYEVSVRGDLATIVVINHQMQK